MADLIRRKQPGEAWETAVDTGGGGGSQTLEDVLAEGNDADDQQIKNLAEGTDPGDAATVSQLGLGAGIIYNVRDYGAVGDLVTDDAAAFQAAFDAAQASIPETGVAGTPVYIPPGDYLISSTITWKDHAIIGAGSNQARLYWGGATGGGTLLMDHRNYGGVKMSGVQFRVGSGLNVPSGWLHMSIADHGDILEEVHFAGGLGFAVAVNTIVNLHWNRLRFSSFGGPALLLQGGGEARNITIDDFTIADGDAAYPSEGFMKIEMNGVGQLGIALRNARIEADPDLWGDDSYLVGLFGADADLGAVKLILENLDFELDDPVPATMAIFYKDAACDDGIIPYINVHRCGFGGVPEFMTGTYTYGGDTWTPPALPSGKMVENWAIGRSGAGGFPNTFEQARIGLLGIDMTCFTSWSATIADGGTLTHGMTRTPRSIHITPTVAGTIVAVTALSTLTATIALKDPDGAPAAEQLVYYTVVCA